MSEQLAVWDNFASKVMSHHRSFTAAQKKTRSLDPLRTGHYSIVRWKAIRIKYGKSGREYFSLMTKKSVAVVLN